MTAPQTERDERATIFFRNPQKEDGSEVWKLVKDTNILDLNSAYTYLLLCDVFPDTCVVAVKGERIIGFVSAFQSPQSADTLFVWQIAVDESMRGQGLGKRLLQQLLEQKSCENIHYLKTTISPSNYASQSLFKSLARDLHCACHVSDYFSEDLFPEAGHEAEELYQIGPF